MDSLQQLQFLLQLESAVAAEMGWVVDPPDPSHVFEGPCYHSCRSRGVAGTFCRDNRFIHVL